MASTTSIVFQALGVALSPDGSEVAVGGDDNGIHIYSLAGDKLTAGAVLNQHPSGVTKVAYSPCGKMLASGDATKNVVVWDAGSKQTMQTENVHHQAKVTSLDWSPDSKRLVSGSLDTKVIVWDIAGGPSKRIMLDRAHPVNIPLLSVTFSKIPPAPIILTSNHSGCASRVRVSLNWYSLSPLLSSSPCSITPLEPHI